MKILSSGLAWKKKRTALHLPSVEMTQKVLALALLYSFGA